MLKAEQTRLKKLLAEAIPLLCKNGIEYKSEFSIEALIGITLDKDQVVLISINETVNNSGSVVQQELEDEDISQTPTMSFDASYAFSMQSSDTPPSRKRRKRRVDSNSITPHQLSPSSNKSPRIAHSNTERTVNHNTLNESNEEDTKPVGHNPDFDATVSVKLEPDDGNDDDLMFIKEDSSDMDLSRILPFEQQSQDMSFPSLSHSHAAGLQGSVSMEGFPHHTGQLAAEGEGEAFLLGEASTSQQVCVSYSTLSI